MAIKRGPPTRASGLGLRRIALFEGLADAELEALAHQCAWRNVEADQPIISRDAHDRSVYFVVSGRVRATMYSRAGKQVTFSEQGAGEFLGELSAIDGEPRTLDVIALESTLVASMTPGASCAGNLCADESERSRGAEHYGCADLPI